LNLNGIFLSHLMLSCYLLARSNLFVIMSSNICSTSVKLFIEMYGV